MYRLYAVTLGEAWREDDFRGGLADGRIAGLSEERAGFLFWREFFDEAELLVVCVSPDARRRGVATRLVKAMLSRLPETKVHLELRASNEAALVLYRACGFVESGRRPRYYTCDGGSHEDAILMTRLPLL